MVNFPETSLVGKPTVEKLLRKIGSRLEAIKEPVKHLYIYIFFYIQYKKTKTIY